MKNLLTIIIAIAIAAFVWFTSDSKQDSKAQTNPASVEAGDQPTSPETQPDNASANPQSAPEQTQKPENTNTPAKDLQPIRKATDESATTTPKTTATATPANGKSTAVLVTLPNGDKEDITATLDRIAKGIKFPHRNDGGVFGNYEGRLPKQSRGYYSEYVHPTPGRRGPGARRIVKGKRGEVYYTHDHYETFIKVDVR